MHRKETCRNYFLSPVRLPFRHTGNRLPASSGGKFSKILNGRKQPIRALWQCNGNIIARIAIEDEAGSRAMAGCR
jgi:hypothetical protein